MDARANALSRPPGGMDREREMFRLANNGAVQSEEKHQTLSLDVDGWEKSKARKKRSGIKSDALTSTVMTRPLDVDREPKQGMLHRLVPDSRSRLSNTHGFRCEFLHCIAYFEISAQKHLSVVCDVMIIVFNVSLSVLEFKRTNMVVEKTRLT